MLTMHQNWEKCNSVLQTLAFPARAPIIHTDGPVPGRTTGETEMTALILILTLAIEFALGIIVIAERARVARALARQSARQASRAGAALSAKWDGDGRRVDIGRVWALDARDPFSR